MTRVLLAAAGMLALLAHPRAAASQQTPIRVVVNAANSVGPISSDGVSRLFLRKRLEWPNGQTAVPVDQTEGSAAWTEFVRAIHRTSVPALRSYWQEQIFSGRATPPPELSSDADVLEFVRRNVNAIGYVSATATLGSGVRLLEVTR